MTKLLLIVGKNVLSDSEGNILILYDNSYDNYEDWIVNFLNSRILKRQECPNLEVDIVHISDVYNSNYKKITISAARKKLKTVEPYGNNLSAYLIQFQSQFVIQFRYGVRNGKVISISELSLKERGLNCNCTCPGCGELLVARLGKKKQSHFAHKGTICDAFSAQQTALHLLAKEIVEEKGRLLFPGISISWDNYIKSIKDNRVYSRIPQSVEYKKPLFVICDSVKLENKVSTIVPDIIVTSKGHTCLVEIAVTHFVNEEKEKRIREIDLPLFEIDLSSFYNHDVSREELTEAILQHPENRKWIYNPIYGKAEKWAKDQYSKLIHDAEEIIEQEDKREDNEAIRRKQRREIGEKKLKKVFEKGYYKKIVASLKNDYKTAQYLASLHCNVDLNTFPFFLNIPISGEMIFPCDRRIWQSALFEKFVYNRNAGNNDKPSVHIKKINNWIVKYNPIFKIDWSIAYKTIVSINSGEHRTISLLNDVVDRFFYYLVYLGFIGPFLLQEAVVLQTHSLIPPNKEHAENLYRALQMVDWYDPYVDDQIIRLIAPEFETLNDYSLFNSTLNRGISKIEDHDNNPIVIEKEADNKLEQEQYGGIEDVWQRDFEEDKPILDSRKRRWVKCTSCGQLFLADQMAYYGGCGSVNKGECRACCNARRR